MNNKMRVLLIVSLLINFTPTSYAHTKDKYRILLISSYNVENIWERDIINNLKEVIKENPQANMVIKREYMDVRNGTTKNYAKDFEELLETKYKDESFDMIITIDDEAFNMVRNELFNENSIFYKKNIVFTGINQHLKLTKEEDKYMTGFMDGKPKTELIQIINDLQPEAKNISIVLDNTYFCNDIKHKLMKNKYLLDKKIHLNFIQGKSEKYVLNQIKDLKDKTDAILLCGLFTEENSKDIVKTDEFINHIKEIKNVPIYTSRVEYLSNGAVGGYIDNGEDYGRELGMMVMKIYEDNSIKDMPVVEQISADYMVDYKEIYKYNLDIENLPKHSLVINKKNYELLLPKDYKIVYYLVLLILILSVTYVSNRFIRLKREESKNKKLFEMAEEREKLKTDFIANMSHEFRTPLNIITSASALLEMKAKKDGKIEKDYILDKLDNINQNSNRLIRLINNFVDISKFDAGFYECERKNENIVYVVEDIVYEVVDYANEKNIELIFDTEEEEIITFIDKEKIERVILNLLSNAIKFTNENGKIEVDIKKKDDKVHIKVKDNGIGIDEEEVAQIFHRFYQVDSLLCRKNEGSGIGLCIVDEIIKMHNGYINIESEVNMGTTFEVVLNISPNYMDYEEEICARDIKNIVKIEMADI